MVKKATKTTKTKKASATALVKTKKAATKPAKVAVAKTKEKKPSKKITAATLLAWNKWLGLFYAVQGIALLIVSTTYSLPVVTNFLTKDTFVSKPDETPVLAAATEHLFDANLMYLVAAILFIAALTHIVLATVYHKRYEQELVAGINRVRWAGFGVVAALSAVTLGLIGGVYDISLLVSLFVLTIIASLSGLAVEVYSQGTPRHKLAYVIGWIAAIMTWLVLGTYLLGANIYGSGNIPAYVYGIFGSMLILSLAIAMNTYLQYKKRGKWADYLYGERMYSILAFIAVSALAWQVFAGLLQP